MTKKAGYYIVQKNLEKMIVMGDYEVGDMLPSENKLADEYKLSRMTIRHALRNLEVDGLIYRQKGKGSFVGSKRKEFRLGFSLGFSEVMKSKSIDFSTEIIQKPIIQNWEKDIDWILNEKEKEAGCIHFSRNRIINGKPIMVEFAYVSNIGLQKFCSQPFINGSFFDTLFINYDIEIQDPKQKFKAILATPELAKRFNIEINSPLLQINRKIATSKPNLFIYSLLYFDTSQHSFES